MGKTQQAFVLATTCNVFYFNLATGPPAQHVYAAFEEQSGLVRDSIDADLKRLSIADVTDDRLESHSLFFSPLITRTLLMCYARVELARVSVRLQKDPSEHGKLEPLDVRLVDFASIYGLVRTSSAV